MTCSHLIRRFQGSGDCAYFTAVLLRWADTLWNCSIGRADDVLVLANGEKVVPGPTEGALLAQGIVTGAILFGRERNQAGVLVEPAEAFAFDPTDESDLAAFRNKIWCASGSQKCLIPALTEDTGPLSTKPTDRSPHSLGYLR
jgi:hypothetical protein